MNEPREQGWLQKIIEDADRRVNNWPDWKKELTGKYDCSSSKEEPSDSDNSGDESQSQD
jgi:hypothetical protein